MIEDSIKILHIVPSLSIESGGPAYTVTSLCRYLQKHGENTKILTTYDAHPGAADDSFSIFELGKNSVKATSGIGNARLRVFWSPAFSLAIRNEILNFKPDIIHSHGIWRLENHSAVKIGRNFGIPVIITPRGEISSWALKQKGIKKRFAWNLYQKRDFKTATAIHATAQNELEDAQKLDLRRPIAVIPNGVELPNVKCGYVKESGNRTRRVLFMSRIHPKKGLEKLICAWREIDSVGWRCDIVGPGDTEYIAALKRSVSELGLDDQIFFFNMIYGEKKWETFSNSDLFVLPTNSENFGVVVAEALASGIPVITTKNAPWKELEDRKCGWWIEAETTAVARALKMAMALSDEDRREMGMRGRQLVAEKYSWPRIASEMSAVYRWICARGPKPRCVRA